jgi:hypothetical protein
MARRDQSIGERFSNVRRGKKADREVRPTGRRASSKPLPLEEKSS